MRSVHGNGGTEEAAMTSSLFSLPETQYINIEHIDLVEERERQLPKDRRPRIQQGFAASLFLPLSLFSGNFWLQMTFLGGANTFYRGQGACRPVAGRQGPVARWPGDRSLRGPPRRFSMFLAVEILQKNPVARPLGDRTPVAR